MNGMNWNRKRHVVLSLLSIPAYVRVVAGCERERKE
jgi:hypothetical protein